jgi:hypothetical protein
MQLHPVAVVLYLVKPLVAARRFRLEGGELGRDEPGISAGFAPSAGMHTLRH